MSDTIDKRIVEMAFENDKFEKGVGTSLGTIDKLKKSLNFDDAAKSFGGITAAANKVNLGSIANGVESIASRFSAMGIVALTVLANIANSAYQVGARIVSALTIDPIKTGLNEYETKLNSVQTILANTQKEGTNLKIVTDALNKLNEYSDKTIYNFQQMTRNVGTFTAAGVSLDTSVAAIKGIANLAAISGSNAEQASTAMYQLSQALSSGTVKLMDWNSVVNAGMGGQVFQDAIKETARLHGVAIDQMIEEEGSFRETLQRGWFTSEILTETLAKFTGDLNEDQLRTMGYTEDQIKSIIKMGQTANDAATKVKTFTQLFDTLKEAAQSGWAQTWEIIIGNFDEAKISLTEINNILGGMIGASADARNDLLQAWKDLGGRDALIASVANAFNAVMAIVKPLKEALREIFPPITAQQLFDLTEGLRKLTESFKIGEKEAEILKRIFKGLFALVDIGRMAISALLKNVFGLSTGFKAPIKSLFELLAVFGDFIVGIRNGLKETDGFNKVLAKVGETIKPVITFITDLFKSIFEGMGSLKSVNMTGISTFINNLKVRFEPLKTIFGLATKFLNLIEKALVKLGPIFFKLGSIIATGTSKFMDKIMVALDNFDPQKVFNIINSGLLAGILLAIRKFISEGTGMFSGVKDILDGVKDSLTIWQNTLKADTLLKIAAALGLLTLSVVALSMIDSKKLASALGAMTVMFVQLGLSLSAFQKISSSFNPLDMAKVSIGLIAISSAMLLMSIAVSKLGKMKPEELINGLLAVLAIVGMMKLSAQTLSASSGKMIKGAAALIIFSFAIRSLAVAVKKLGALDADQLTKGLVSVGVLLGELALFLKVTDLSGMGLVKSVGILVLAASIAILANSVAKLAAIDANGLTKGLVTIGLIFGEIAAFMALTGGQAGLLVVAAGVLVLSAAMAVMANVMVTLGNLSWEDIAQGLVALAGALTLIGAAAYLIPPTLVVTAGGMVVMAAALVILAQAMRNMGGMSWDEVGRGLTVLGGSLLILAFALNVMNSTLPGSAALLVAAAALAVMAPALKTMGSMSLEEIGRGLVAMAGAFVVLGVAGALMTPVIPTLLALGAAMVLVGIGMAGLGVGVLALATGMAALAVAGTAGIATFMLLLTSVVGIIPMVVKQLGIALLSLIDTLVAGAPTLLKGVVTLINILLDGLIEATPKVITAVFTLIDGLLSALKAKMPRMVEAGYSILISFLQGVKRNIGDVASIAIEIVANFLKAVAEKLPELVMAGWDLIVAWIDSMALSAEENIPRLMEALRGLGLAIVKGVVKGIAEGASDAKRAIVELGKIIIDGFKEFFGIHSPSSVFVQLALQLIAGLVLGIQNGIGSVMTKVRNLATDIVNALKDKYTNMVSAGKDLVRGFGEGITSFVSTAVNAAANLARAVLAKIKQELGINSPAKELIDVGMYADQGLAKGITKFAGVIINATKKLGQDTISGFGTIVSGISDAINTDLSFSPTIRPVMDLSEIKTGASSIDGLLADKTLNVGVAAVKAQGISNSLTPSVDTTDGVSAPAVNSPISFTQINNSPKELSRIDIYRQTRNQLLQAKRLVGQT